MHRWLFLVSALWLGSLAAAATPLPPGRGQAEMTYAGAPLTLYTYKPAGYTDGPLLIVFHGVVRNAQDYRDFAITLADRFKLLLVAPQSAQLGAEVKIRVHLVT